MVDVQVGSTRWHPSFIDELSDGENLPLGAFYSIPVQSGEQLVALPWSGIDVIRLTLSEDVVVRADDLKLAGVNFPDHPLHDFFYDSDDRSATWFLQRPLGNDKLLIDLSGFIIDTAGNTLDGDWTDGADLFPSGDGSVAEGIEDFRFRLNTLPGDVNFDARLTRSDLLEVVFAQGVEAGEAGYEPHRDVDGDGRIGLSDLRIVLAGQATRLPTGDPTPGDGSAAGLAVDEVFTRLGGANSPSPAATTPIGTSDHQMSDGRGERLRPHRRFDTRRGLGLVDEDFRRVARRRSARRIFDAPNVELSPLDGAAADESTNCLTCEIRTRRR
ncbi:MAG: hypothetical protein IIA67_10605 [Planctomycetes bacterium]|nr:hypothetical protein [Planctomycetota bacterium]